MAEALPEKWAKTFSALAVAFPTAFAMNFRVGMVGGDGRKSLLPGVARDALYSVAMVHAGPSKAKGEERGGS